MVNWKYVLTGVALTLLGIFLDVPIKSVIGREELLLNYGLFGMFSIILVIIGIITIIFGIQKD